MAHDNFNDALVVASITPMEALVLGYVPVDIDIFTRASPRYSIPPSSLAKTQNSAVYRLPLSSQDIINEDGDQHCDMDGEVPQAQPRVAIKAKSKNAPAPWFELIELTDDQLKDMRNEYEQRMSDERGFVIEEGCGSEYSRFDARDGFSISF